MPDEIKLFRNSRKTESPFALTHTSALILQTLGAGYRYGFDVMEATGLPSGTVYPALRRLEQLGLIHSTWEKESKALAEQRPARKYYKLTAPGERTFGM